MTSQFPAINKDHLLQNFYFSSSWMKNSVKSKIFKGYFKPERMNQVFENCIFIDLNINHEDDAYNFSFKNCWFVNVQFKYVSSHNTSMLGCVLINNQFIALKDSNNIDLYDCYLFNTQVKVEDSFHNFKIVRSYTQNSKCVGSQQPLIKDSLSKKFTSQVYSFGNSSFQLKKENGETTLSILKEEDGNLKETNFFVIGKEIDSKTISSFILDEILQGKHERQQEFSSILKDLHTNQSEYARNKTMSSIASIAENAFLKVERNSNCLLLTKNERTTFYYLQLDTKLWYLKQFQFGIRPEEPQQMRYLILNKDLTVEELITFLQN